jgi:hypothetical protein
MKKVISLFFVLAGIQPMHAQMPSDCTVPASLQYHLPKPGIK